SIKRSCHQRSFTGVRLCFRTSSPGSCWARQKSATRMGETRSKKTSFRIAELSAPAAREQSRGRRTYLAGNWKAVRRGANDRDHCCPRFGALSGRKCIRSVGRRTSAAWEHRHEDEIRANPARASRCDRNHFALELSVLDSRNRKPLGVGGGKCRRLKTIRVHYARGAEAG